jgi:hypothetical protein
MMRIVNIAEPGQLNWGRSVPANQQAIGTPTLWLMTNRLMLTAQEGAGRRVSVPHFIIRGMYSVIQKIEWCVAAKFPITANRISHAEMCVVTCCFQMKTKFVLYKT